MRDSFLLLFQLISSTSEPGAGAAKHLCPKLSPVVALAQLFLICRSLQRFPPWWKIAPVSTLKNSLNTKALPGKGEEEQEVGFSSHCFSPLSGCAFFCSHLPLKHFATDCCKFTRAHEVAATTVTSGSTAARPFRKRFLNNFPGGCLSNFTGATSPRPSSSLGISAFLAVPPGWQTRRAQSEKSTMKIRCVLFHFRHLRIVYGIPCAYIEYICMYILISELILRPRFLTPWEMTLPSATYLICASHSCDKLAAQLHKISSPSPPPSFAYPSYHFSTRVVFIGKTCWQSFRLSDFIYASTFWQSISQFFLKCNQ